MKTVMISVIVLAILLVSSLTVSAKNKVNNTPASNVVLPLYLGNWYEIARIDHFFEKGIHNATASYTLKPNGDVKVINSGWKDDKFRSKEAVAKIPDKTKPGHLRVSFFRPFYSDYRILKVAEDYSYALVGGSDGRYLWILSRTPELSDSVVKALLGEASFRGYDTGRLTWVDQSLSK